MRIVKESQKTRTLSVLASSLFVSGLLFAPLAYSQSSDTSNSSQYQSGQEAYPNKSRCSQSSSNSDCAFEYFYLSGAIGANVGGSDLDVLGAASDLGYDVFDVEEDDASLAIKLVLGASLTDRLALELGYTRLADAEVAFSTLTDDPDLFFDLARSVRPAAVDGFTLALSYSFYTSENWFLYGKAGVFNWTGDYDSFNVTANQELPSLETEDGTDLLLGLGASYNINKEFEASFEWERYSFGDFDQNVLWIGLTYHFD